MKTYTRAQLPGVPAGAGIPSGKQATEDVMWNGVKIVAKDQFYNPVWLAAIEAGCGPAPKENKVAAPTESK